MGKTPRRASMGSQEMKPKAEVIAEAKTKGVDIHFGRLMDLCHLKNSELEK